MYVEDVEDIKYEKYVEDSTSSTCFNIHLMVWLESPKSQLFKTFFGLKIR